MHVNMHGHTQRIPHTQAESELERNIHAYADLIIQDEKENYEGGLESPAVHADKMRQQAVNALHEFCDNYAQGYAAICDVLKAAGEEIPEVPEENLKIFKDVDAFMKAIDEGQEIYELLGYSYETLTRFYIALNALVENQEFTKVRDGFFFMITICPNTPEYWIGLGLASTGLQEQDTAEEAYQNAKDCFIKRLHTYVEQSAIADADALCDRAILFAEQQFDKPWASEFKQQFVDAKDALKTNFNESL